LKPFYWNQPNFGDHMNSWLWSEILPERFDSDASERLVGVGSLLKEDLRYVLGKKVVVGSGTGYGAPPDVSDSAEWEILFVRGPLTAQALGIPNKHSIVDGAWLISAIEEFSPEHIKEISGVGKTTVFIPHWTSEKSVDWQNICNDLGIKFISPTRGSRDVIRELSRAKFAIVEALHGAILADYFRIPWVAIKTSTEINDFKWSDFCQSVELDYSPLVIGHQSNATVSNRLEISNLNSALPVPRRVALPRQLYVVKQEVKSKIRPLYHWAKGAVSRNIVTTVAGKVQADRMTKGLETALQMNGSLSTDAVHGSKLDALHSKLQLLRSRFN
jgi:hypothetical protein